MTTTASGVNDTPPELTSCRLCEAPVARDAARCPSCGVKAPWVPDEPSVNPRLIRVAMWGGGVVVLIMLLVRNTSVARDGDFVLANNLVNAVTLVKISK